MTSPNNNSPNNDSQCNLININDNKNIIDNKNINDNKNIIDSNIINYDDDANKKEYFEKQSNRTFTNTWYPNTWIDHIDDNDKPIYESRENITGQSGDIMNTLNSSAHNNFNNNDSKQCNIQDKSIKEVYDTSMIDYKKTYPIKKPISNEDDDIIVQCGSNLKAYTSDTWTYDDENPENGGILYDALYANDPESLDNAVF